MSIIEFDEEHFRDPNVTGEQWFKVVLRVAHNHGIPVNRLLSRDRCKSVARARRAAYIALREHGWSYPEIGKFMNRDHTTIMQVSSARRRVRPRRLSITLIAAP